MSDGVAPAMQGKVTNAKVSDPVSTALEAFKSGKDVSKEVYGTPDLSPKGDSGQQDVAEESFSSDEFMNGSDGEDKAEGAEGSENSKESEPSTLDEVVNESKAKANKEQSKLAKDIEEIIITDESGRKKLTVDWNDKAKLRKYVEMAAGMRKFQAERDRTSSKLKEIEPKFKDLSESWAAIEKAYSEDGVKGLVNLLSGKNDGYDRYIQQEFARAKAKEDASPAELRRMELEEQLVKQGRESEKLKKQVEETLRQASEKESTASLKSLESQVHPAFDRYRFAGKLGDPTVEHQLDTAVWNQALQRLEEYPDDVEITSSLIDKEFKTVANTFRKIIKQQGESTAKKVIAQKKVDSQTKAANRVMQGYKANNSADEFRNDIKKGNLTSALTSLMTGKFKF